MAKRGRPAGADSTATRARIVDVARGQFATKAFAGTSMTSVAAEAELAPSAIYHYFSGKAELYEAVFEATSAAIWNDIGGSVVGYPSLTEAIRALTENARHLSETHPHFSDFLALVPMEARIHQEFAHLLDRRSKYQDETFGALAELGIATGELAGFSQAEATEIIRTPVMGWFFERHFRGSEMDVAGKALGKLFEALAAR